MSTAYEHKTQLVGDDYTGLPTRPVKYRGARKGSSIDWDQIQANYIARGGQVDASVWPNHGKVVVIGSSNARSSRVNVHSFVEATDDEYAEPVPRPDKPRSTADYKRTPNRPNTKIRHEQYAEVGRRYTDGASLNQLAATYSVSVSTIVKVLKAAGVQTRDRGRSAS